MATGGSPLRAPCSRPLMVVPTAGCCPRGRRFCPQALPLLGATGLPFRLALAVANRHHAGGLGRGLAVGGRKPWL
ncbi:hypothetical protein BHE74_00028757 [Ensete ventricosum]|nr:hypothetical protein BHE74_00028757 [Ensete ventricosum]